MENALHVRVWKAKNGKSEKERRDNNCHRITFKCACVLLHFYLHNEDDVLF